ncbi:hypothetical protein GPECTOR_491g442 [Gonium pectorale]|uniref:Uncharacterized protein n=1 Tax=Gonium pectorale TaxID=33097 RepID=A0A150FUU8_GONPE|nr:hypothetical protein GPECTOR_491g442 [Gonium pectorale]|eukprot:KXZ41401.1 hypothetical protein GPECTOR_491g442 [Gonium pectorale]
MKRKVDKQEDEAVISVRADIGYSGPANWPKFDPFQPILGVRSRAPASLPASCGPLLAGPPALLPAFTPRNHHFTTLHELDMPLDHEFQMGEQLAWFQAAHSESFVPRELLIQMLKDDMIANTELEPFYRSPSAALIAAAAAAGYPSYDAAAAALRGNRLAAVPLPGPEGLSAVFSATGQIGEVLTLTLLRNAAPDQHRCARGGPEAASAAADRAGSGAGGADGAGGAGVSDACRSKADGLGAGGLEAGGSGAGESGAGGDVPRPYEGSGMEPGAGAAANRPLAGMPAGGGAAGADGRFWPASWRLGEETAAAPAAAAAVGAGGKREGEGEAGPESDGRAAGAAAGGAASGPALWVAVRCNFSVNVLLAYQVDPTDWRSWRLEWRASHPTSHLTAGVAWNPHLPELALMTADGAVAVASTAAAGGGAEAALRSLTLRPVLRPLPPAVRKGYGPAPPPPAEPDPQPLAMLLGTGGGRMSLAYGLHPRQLLVARGRELLRLELRSPGQRHTARLLVYLGKRDGNFWGLTTGASLPAEQLAAAPALLPHLAVALTEREVLLLDLRRCQGGWGRSQGQALGRGQGEAVPPVLLAWPHCLPRGQLPTMAALWADKWTGPPSGGGSGGSGGSGGGGDDGGGGNRRGKPRSGAGDGGGGDGVDAEMRDGAAAGPPSAARTPAAAAAAAAAARGGGDPHPPTPPLFASQFADFDPYRGPGSAADAADAVATIAGGSALRTPGAHLYGTQASQAVDPDLDDWPSSRAGAGASAGGAAAGGGAAVGSTGAPHPAAGTMLRLLVVLGNEGCGDLMCSEVVLEDAPFALRVRTVGWWVG